MGGLYNELFVNHYQGSDRSEISESAPQGSVSRAGFAQKSWGLRSLFNLKSAVADTQLPTKMCNIEQQFLEP
ncbi:MAG: hypothetical protein DMG13_28730 [Acidobacteria bacterium]|nr:MAG: hypothetical protein DMG13_28730 [Acidobacteriota bacterium]